MDVSRWRGTGEHRANGPSRRLAFALGTLLILATQLAPAALAHAAPLDASTRQPAVDASPAVDPTTPPVNPTPVPPDPTAAPVDPTPAPDPTAAPPDPTAAPPEATPVPTEAAPDPTAPTPPDPTPAPPTDPVTAPAAALVAQTVVFDPAPTMARVGATGVTVHATASTTVTYSSLTTSVCTVDGATGVLTLLATGTCSIQGDAAADATYEAATAQLDFTVYEAVRGCRSYTAQSFVGAVILNADGTPIGCGMTEDKGAPADLVPANWDATWASEFGNTAYPIAYTQRLGWACDDCWMGADGQGRWGSGGTIGFPIGFPINFYGTTYTTVFVNSNGSIAFGHGSSDYDVPLDEILSGAAGVVPYGLDLFNGYPVSDYGSYATDRGVRSPDFTFGTGRHEDFFYWGRTTYQGHIAFVATWMNMGPCCSDDPTALATFQVMLVDIDDAAGSDLDIIVNYGSVEEVSQGYDCPDGDSYTCIAIGLGTVDGGVATYASIVDDNGFLYNGQLDAVVADTGAHPLSQGHLNSNVPGRFKFQMRDGTLPQTATPPGPPTITSAVRGDGEGTVSWNPPANLGGSPILQYELRWRALGDATWTTDSTGASPFTMTGLTNGTTYEVQVAATNGVGTGAWSTRATFTPGAEGSPQWTDVAICSFKVGVACSNGVHASGTPAPTYAVTAGALPAGIVLDAATGALTGTPTTAGSYDFTITASNDSGTVTWQFTGAVASASVPAPETSTAAAGTTGSGPLGLLVELAAAAFAVVVFLVRTRRVVARRPA